MTFCDATPNLVSTYNKPAESFATRHGAGGWRVTLRGCRQRPAREALHGFAAAKWSFRNDPVRREGVKPLLPLRL